MKILPLLPAAISLLLTSFSLHAETPPNIIFILTDDQRDDSFNAMGHPWVETPQVDKLLTQSTRFANTYVAEPICRPSRAALMLGCNERVNRQGFSSTDGMRLSQWEESYPTLLKKANYYTGFVGKWHVQTEGFSFDSLFDYCDGHTGHGPFFFETTDAEGKVTRKTTNRHHTDNALKFLDTTSAEKPFCLSLCYATPHGSKVRKMHSVYHESSSLNPKLKDHPIYGGQYRDIEFSFPLQKPQNPYDHIPKNVLDQDKGRNKTYRFDYNVPSCKEHHIRYYQMITELDEMVGDLLAGFKERKLDQNTILIFGSDHGLLLGEYGMGGKGLLYDLTVKIPCFIYDPQAAPEARGQEREEIVSSLDITTTILDYAGLKNATFMEGASLKPLVQTAGPVEGWRKGLFLESLYTGRDTPIQEGYLEDGWKYIRYFKAEMPYQDSDLRNEEREPVFEMLFNLKSDPGEINNLVDSPEAAEVLAKLREKCLGEVTRLNGRRDDYQALHFSSPSPKKKEHEKE